MEKGNNLKKILIIAGAAVVAIAAFVAVFIGSQKLTATTMRLLKKEGEVKLFDKDKEKTIIDNLRLASGNALTTAAESIASIALDDTKIVTLNNNSRADFEQKGKKLQINLTEGSLFFQVKEKLEADASFDIKTANLVVGIRGTSGLVEANPDGTHSVTITDGEVEVSIVNKETGQTKTIRVKAGEKAKIVLHDNSVEDSIEVIMDELHVADLGTVITDRLVEDEDLMIKVCDATGWNEEEIRMVNENPDALVATGDGSDNNPDGTDPDGTDPGGTPGSALETAEEGSLDAGENASEEEQALLTEEQKSEEGEEKKEEEVAENSAEATENSGAAAEGKTEDKDSSGKKEESKDAAGKTADADKKTETGEAEGKQAAITEPAKTAAEAPKQNTSKQKDTEAAKQKEAEAAKQQAAAEAARQQELAKQQAAAEEAAKQAEAQKQAEWEAFQAALKAAEEEAKERERQEQAAAAAAAEAAAVAQQSSVSESQGSSDSEKPDYDEPQRPDEPWNDPTYNPDGSEPWNDPNYNPDDNGGEGGNP